MRNSNQNSLHPRAPSYSPQPSPRTINYSRIPVNHQIQISSDKVDESCQKTDEQFYYNLKHYTPLCYSGEGIPFLLKNKNWYYNLPCMVLLNALIVMVILVFLSNVSKNNESFNKSPYSSQQDPTKFIIINIAILIFINIFYFLTQFMNPGIVNFSKISEQEYQEEKGKYFCIRCDGYRTGEMEHCDDCQTCLRNLDHHCGFFNKCIAGYQTYAFYGFLTSVFIGFLSLLVTLTSSVGL